MESEALIKCIDGIMSTLSVDKIRLIYICSAFIS